MLLADADARYEYAAPDALFFIKDSHVWNKRFERASGLSLNECSIVDPTGWTTPAGLRYKAFALLRPRGRPPRPPPACAIVSIHLFAVMLASHFGTASGLAVLLEENT